MRLRRISYWLELVSLLAGLSAPFAQPVMAQTTLSSQSGVPSSNVAMNMSADGSKVCAVWTTFDIDPQVYFRLFDTQAGTWSPNLSDIPAQVSEGSNSRVVLAHCAFDPSGGVHVVWSQGAGQLSVMERTLKPSGDPSASSDWSAPETVAGNGSNPDVAVAPDGTVWVAYQTPSGSGLITEVRSSNGGSWSSATNLSVGVATQTNVPRVVIDRSGNVFVAWTQTSNNAMIFTYKLAGSSWQPATTVPGAPNTTGQFGLAVNPSTGEVYIDYAHGDPGGAGQAVYYVHKPLGQAFSQPVAVTQLYKGTTVPYLTPRIALGSDGQLYVVVDYLKQTIQTYTGTVAGSFTKGPDIAPSGGAEAPWVTAGAGGAYIAYAHHTGQEIYFLPFNQAGQGDGVSLNNGSGGIGVGPTPVSYTVPDCPGVTRKIDATHVPPSIYGKPKAGACGSETTTGGSTTGGIVTGVCPISTTPYGTSDQAPAAGTVFWTITGGKTFDITQGFGDTDYAKALAYPGTKDTRTNAEVSYGYTTSFGFDHPGHGGVDIGTPEGTDMYSPVSGTVVVVTDEPPQYGGGRYFYYGSSASAESEGQGELRILLDNGDQLILGHMLKITVNVGDKIVAGQPVGQSGNEFGGAHIHVEYRQGGTKLVDPRNVFDCQGSGAGTTTPPIGQTATSYSQFVSKYGFDANPSRSDKPFGQYSSQFATERDLAIKYAPNFNIEPEMVVWWTWFETQNPYDSYHYSNCNDSNYNITSACGVDNWQIGYGQQWSLHTLLTKAFQVTHGDPNNAQLTQQVGNDVLSHSGLSPDFPLVSAQSLSDGSDRLSAFILMRDPAISAYMVAAEIRGDLDAHPGETYRQITCGWDKKDHPYYCLDSTWTEASNILNDVIINWGVAGSGTIDTTCLSTYSPTSSSCSTLADNFNGMDLQEFVRRINENMSVYKQIAQCANVPWEMMAAIHFRETGLDPNFKGPGTGGALGPWQIDPTSGAFGQVDPYDFYAAGCYVAKNELQAKAVSGPVGRALSQNMDPATKNDEYSIKDAFFAYNGRGGYEVNIGKGCTPAIDGNSQWNWDCSAYVMSLWDANHQGMCINDTSYCPNYDGAWKIYFKLHYSTYDSNGNLLVYGGKCDQTQGASSNGVALPTSAGKLITSQFNQNNTAGIGIGNAVGDPVFAMADGQVVASGWDSKGGYYLIEHVPSSTQLSQERWVFYGHMAPEGLMPAGSVVKMGQQIGTTGALTVKDPNGNSVTNGVETSPQLQLDIRAQQSEDPTTSINPCTIDIFKQGYPSLQCTSSGGLSWQG